MIESAVEGILGARSESSHSIDSEPASVQPPVLRQDLDVYPVDADQDGAPAWVLHDQSVNKYYRIGEVAVDMLPYVDGRPVAELVSAVNRRYDHAISEADVENLFQFLRVNYLCIRDHEQEKRAVAQRAAQPTLASKILKGYISFRVPLVHPDKFLDKTLGIATFLTQRAVLALCALMGVLGLFLVTRQWDVFLATLVGFVSVEGVVAYTGVIFLVKSFHELGHAYAAKSRGLRVPTIGIAFIVFWPIAYTDTTDAWKLSRRKDRLAIGVAGVGTELAIACIALFLWNVVPDGPFRSVLFLLATTTWFTSLIINLNPLMRFDGYYLFSDLVRIPNLEHRANGMGRWRLRKALLGIDVGCPEPARRWLAVFAFAVWFYRFFLFLGIALAVYLLFFKALGVLLAVIEIIYFIGMPIFRELAAWEVKSLKLRGNKTLVRNIVILGITLLVLLVPWQRSITAPGVLKTNYQTIYAPEGGYVAELTVGNGDTVEGGALLVKLKSNELSHDLAQAMRRREILVEEAQSLGVDAIRRKQATVVRADVIAQARTLKALETRNDRMSIHSPYTGRITALSDFIRVGGWVTADEPLLAITGTVEQVRLETFIVETDVGRISVGDQATFYPDGGIEAPLKATVINIEPTAVNFISIPMITSSYAGDVLVRQNEDGVAVPLIATYKIGLTLNPGELDTETSPAMLRGRTVIEGKPQSILMGFWQRLAALFQRETGF